MSAESKVGAPLVRPGLGSHHILLVTDESQACSDSKGEGTGLASLLDGVRVLVDMSSENSGDFNRSIRGPDE